MPVVRVYVECWNGKKRAGEDPDETILKAFSVDCVPRVGETIWTSCEIDGLEVESVVHELSKNLVFIYVTAESMEIHGETFEHAVSKMIQNGWLQQ